MSKPLPIYSINYFKKELTRKEFYANNFSEQEYLPDAIKETRLYDPGSNSRENGTREFLKNRWKDKYGY